ncbi:MAG: sigma-70 family RNA polymerase sigma factor [Bacteroidota bacterium]
MGKLHKKNDNNPLKDPNVFEAFFNEFFPSLTIFANRFLNDVDQAHDIVQESFIAVWEKKPKLSSVVDLRYYLYAVIRNKCVSYIRHQKVKTNFQESFMQEQDVYFFDSALIEQEVFLLLNKAIKELAPQTQKIINLSLQGYSNNEISEDLDISINTTKTLKKRAYKKLRQQLKYYFYIFLYISNLL